MSPAQQLDLDGVFGGLPIKATKKREPITRFTCKCGHHQDLHANRRHTGACASCLGQCKRFRPKSKPPVEQPAQLAAPNGAIILERDEAKRAPWTIGWALVDREGAWGRAGEHVRVTIYLTQLKTKSPNEQRHVWGSKLAQKTKFAIANAEAERSRERTISALAQVADAIAGRGKPSSVRLTRVSAGELDDDGPMGALKFVRDGVAKALDFDDREFSIAGVKPEAIRLDYAQEKCPPRVCGVRIEITWRNL